MKNKAKYIGPEDIEYKYGEIYQVYPLKDVPSGDLIAAVNDHGESYALPAEWFEVLPPEEQGED